MSVLELLIPRKFITVQNYETAHHTVQAQAISRSYRQK